MQGGICSPPDVIWYTSSEPGCQAAERLRGPSARTDVSTALVRGGWNEDGPRQLHDRPLQGKVPFRYQGVHSIEHTVPPCMNVKTHETGFPRS